MKYESVLNVPAQVKEALTIQAQQNNDIQIKAGAGTNEEGAGGTGVGASFALTTANLKSIARIDAVEVEAGDITVQAAANSEILTQTVTGAKGEEAAEETEETEAAEEETL